MQTPFDHFTKQLLVAALAPTGAVAREVEVAPEVQRADVVFQPDGARDAQRVELGLLGRMSSESCLFEPFTRTPVLLDVLRCLQKPLALLAARRAKKGGRSVPPGAHPLLWVISSGRPPFNAIILTGKLVCSVV